ncbi:mRNA turnover and ribosome assembly protein [Puccinia graminis f. sp. tritici]|uniref:Ribosome assembly factor mrt4 n=1 Tax=Puccinia graminis f. sp. tritici TaxID=56615 RepID=A0A5B0PX18_PUCGR|nr:mRNA turnover and ribosome assembly protein [Puccinia graminis f. sp. tritici]KAA1105446.1 mRNA turnover and ribosome assembly protein [Puccinia graminis f. sp. tritici]
MPKSKRQTIVHLSKTSKKTKEVKAKLIEQIKEASENFQFVWLFTVDHVRTAYLQDIRSSWKPSRIFMGRNAVMRLGLGSKEEDEHMPGLGAIGKLLEGDTGLLFTNEPPKVVVEWFDDYVKADYARKGNLATETVELPAGPVMIKEINDEPSVAPGALEPHLRALGLPTTLQSRIPTLSSPHVVCKEGEKLDTNQAGLLKTLGYQMAQFKIVLSHVWIKDRSTTFSIDQIRDQLK